MTAIWLVCYKELALPIHVAKKTRVAGGRKLGFGGPVEHSFGARADHKRNERVLAALQPRADLPPQTAESGRRGREGHAKVTARSKTHSTPLGRSPPRVVGSPYHERASPSREAVVLFSANTPGDPGIILWEVAVAALCFEALYRSFGAAFRAPRIHARRRARSEAGRPSRATATRTLSVLSTPL